MKNLISILILTSVLGIAGCSGDGSNPFDPEETATDGEGDGDGGTGGDDGDPIDSARELPPGTASPTPVAGIFRFEPTDDEANGGNARAIAYDAENDRFSVDNLPFDGDNSYPRDDVVGSLGPYAVYENSDPIDGVEQFEYKAIYGVSKNSGRTEFAIVRTGGFIPFGFGGFVYQRNVDVDVPTEGQATYEGDYAGLRVFDGAGGIQYTTGFLVMDVDFADFNAAASVKGDLTDREVFDTAGNNLINIDLPDVGFVLSSGGDLDANGEMTGGLFSTVANADGIENFEEGTYYGILAGEDADEIVGVMVLNAPRDNPDADLATDGVSVRETGGFIVYRNEDE